MKKIYLAAILTLVLALLVPGSAFAKNDKININGEVTAKGDGTITVLSHKGETFVITVPAGFDLDSVQVGDSILVKGRTTEDGAVVAESIKLLGNGNDQDDSDTGEDQDQAEGGKENSAYCTDGKQEKSHPLAARIAERYGVTESWVMERFCAGYGVGQIMLALKTGEIEGIQADPESLLTERASGVGWGNIWKNLGLIGSVRVGHSPPGLLKKPDHPGPKN